MNLNHLHYFRVLAKVEHYTKAATQLFIPQPSLSNAISILEKELDTFLFEKQGINVCLTKYGRFFLTYVDKALG
ncbi:TPA: LysR family transcriptional regulator [Clostridioides difficile]|nr:LysR family transcriptional regulator [Clostridioides difficile]HBG7265321.1 LysR family transcriptional regulator [Clostridioides difficile]HBG7269309.1 LysR family transcriptional regulator [Clostridioides difficile]HBG7272658.1 LysR family transcriptional regulator [Clostridioides difficile]HBG7273015.1 LysR family transcriptional regulator [Clostridioides difficile]